CNIPTAPTSTLFPYTTLFRSLKLFMESSTNYASDQASGDIQLYAEDGQTITKDTAVINVTHKSSTISEVEIPSSDNEKDLGKMRSEEHTSELQSRFDIVCRLL